MLGDPAARPLGIVVSGRQRLLDPGPEQRSIRGAGRASEKPLPEPVDALLKEADSRSGDASLGKDVPPRADDAAPRSLQVGQQSWHGVGVRIRPATHHKHGDLDGRVVLGDRALAPELVATLVSDPVRKVGRREFEPFEPPRAPLRTDDLGVGRARVEGKHPSRPLGHVAAQKTAAGVVAVIRVAVVGGVERHDGLELRWSERRYLQAVEAAPRVADHPDRARAPLLRLQPRQDFQSVGLLLRKVLTQAGTFGVAGAADVHAHSRKPVCREVGMPACVLGCGSIVLAVGEVLQNRRHPVLYPGIIGQPESRRQSATVCERNPHRRHFANQRLPPLEDGS